MKIIYDNYRPNYVTALLSPVDMNNHGITGCPMGRGTDKQSALDDLVYRVRIESKVDITEIKTED